jgi:hypothetical protein
LDSNFATAITLGNTAVYLGNTTTSIGNLTLTNVTISSGNVTLTNVSVTTANVSGTANITTLVTTNDATISGLTVGKGAGAVATNTAVGASALAGSNSGTGHNTALGYNASITNTTGSDGVSVGHLAGYTNTTGAKNTFCGSYAGYFNSTGSSNTSLGYSAYAANTTAATGSFNVAIGDSALLNNTTASNNTAVGYQAGYTNTAGTYNAFFGWGAGYSSNAATGYNTFVGPAAGYYVTSGAKNTIIGGYTGNQSGLDIRTASNYIVLSDGDGNPRAYWDDTGKPVFTQSGASKYWVYNVTTASAPFGFNINYTASAPNGTSNNFIICSDSSTDRFYVRSNGGISNFSANNTNLSDERTKTDIQNAGGYLAKICAIPVRTFKYKDQSDSLLNLGVIAQEVEIIAPELVDTTGFGKTPDDGIPLKAIYQTDLQYALMKCIQELKAEVDSLKAQINGASA